MGISLGQTPTGIGNDGTSPVIISLVEDSPQARSTSIDVQFERLGKIDIGQNGCCGAQTLLVIELLLASVTPGAGSPLLSCILARHQFLQGLDYLHELGDILAIVSHEPKKALYLSDSGGVGHF